MKVLLIGDESELKNLVRAELQGKHATLKVAGSLRVAEDYIQRERPDILLFGLMEHGNSIKPDQIHLPANYEVGRDFLQFDLVGRSLSTAAAESAAYFLRNLRLPEALTRPGTSPLLVKNGKVALAQRSRPSKPIEKKARAARHALVEAREALAGLASFEEDPRSVGNRTPAPLTREVIRTIGLTLDASIASTQSPVLGKVIVEHWKATTAFLKDAERVIRQVERTGTAGIKAAAVLGALAAALGAAVWKLQELIAALG